jgi:hypothetical protein
MNRSTIIQQRLYNQGLSTKPFHSAEEVCAFLGPIQGQDYPGAKWSIGLRTNLAEPDIEDEINSRKIVRSWPLRGTLHLVNASDLRWILALTRPFGIKAYSSLYKKHELTEKILTKCFNILTGLMKDGKSVTRQEITSALNKKGISTGDSRSSLILYRAAVQGLICFGARRGKQFTYALLDEWIPASNPFPADEALYTLSKKYFQSRGPASLKDFMWWSGLPKSEASKGIDMIKPEFIQEEFEGTSYYFPEVKAEIPKATGTLLLPGFDEYLLGYSDRSAVLDIPFLEILKQGNAMFLSTIVVKGRVLGSWRRTFKKDSVLIETKLLQRSSKKSIPGLERAMKHYGKFLSLNPELI